MSEPRTCESCPWGSRYADHGEYDPDVPEGIGGVETSRTPSRYGECRKRPPVWTTVSNDYDDGHASAFPVTAAGEWCGEHPERRSPPKKPKDPPKAASMIFPQVGP